MHLGGNRRWVTLGNTGQLSEHLSWISLNNKELCGWVFGRLSKKSFVGFHMARDEGLFILDWRQFYRPKNGSVRLDQSE